MCLFKFKLKKIKNMWLISEMDLKSFFYNIHWKYYELIRAFSYSKAFLYILIGRYS